MDKPSRATFRARLDQMIHQLKEDILSGKLPDGSYLPAEVELGEQFQLSKKSVRKGLEALVNDGLIVKKAKVGNMVNSTSSADKKITVRFGLYYGVDQELQIQKLIKQFEQQYPSIKIKPVSMFNYNYAEQTIEFMNDGILDVVMLNYQHFNYFQTQNKVQIFLEQKLDPDIYQFLNRAFTDNNKLFLKSLSFSPIVLCYNKKHFKEIDLQEPDSSWTWNDLIDASQALSMKNDLNKRYGFLFSSLSINRWPLFLLQQNFKLKRDEHGKFILRDDEAFIKGIEQLKAIFSHEDSTVAFFDQTTDPERLFVDERVSIILTSYFRLNYMKNIKFEYNVTPIPFTNTPKTLLINIGLGVNNFSANKEAAQLFVDFMTSKDGQSLIRENTLSIPSMKSVAEKPRQNSNIEPTRYQMFKEIIPSFHYYTDMDFAPYMNMMTHYLKLYLSGLETAQNVAAMIEDELNNGNY